jgi:hypothetical protein
MKFDVPGDIHGQDRNLDTLLAKLGYAKGGQLWAPPQGRQPIFHGDLIMRCA